MACVSAGPPAGFSLLRNRQIGAEDSGVGDGGRSAGTAQVRPCHSCFTSPHWRPTAFLCGSQVGTAIHGCMQSTEDQSSWRKSIWSDCVTAVLSSLQPPKKIASCFRDWKLWQLQIPSQSILTLCQVSECRFLFSSSSFRFLFDR